MFKKIAIITSLLFFVIAGFHYFSNEETSVTNKISQIKNLNKTNIITNTITNKDIQLKKQPVPSPIKTNRKIASHSTLESKTINIDSKNLEKWQKNLISKLKLDRPEVKGLSIKHFETSTKSLRGKTLKVERVKLRYMINGIEKAYDAYINSENGHIEMSWNHLIIDQIPSRKKVVRLAPTGILEKEED